MSKPVLEDLLTFKGRRNRKSYLLSQLFIALACFAAIIPTLLLYAPLGDAGAMIGIFIFYGACIVGSVAVFATSVQRFHDIGRSGWFVLLLFVPMVSLGVQIALGVIAGDEGENEYGRDPLDEDPMQEFAGLSVTRGGVIRKADDEA